jgi:hypothetical protein
VARNDDGAVWIVDTLQANERLTSAALGQADVVVVPTRIGEVEGIRLTSTLDMVPAGVPAGWW